MPINMAPNCLVSIGSSSLRFRCAKVWNPDKKRSKRSASASESSGSRAALATNSSFDLTLTFDWPLLISTAVLVTITAAAVGYMIAVALPPVLTNLVTQALAFFVILFSPITFAASQLPDWFQTIHDVLPIAPAADLMRAGLASTAYTAHAGDLMVLVVWCALGFGVSMLAMTRRS